MAIIYSVFNNIKKPSNNALEKMTKYSIAIVEIISTNRDEKNVHCKNCARGHTNVCENNVLEIRNATKDARWSVVPRNWKRNARWSALSCQLSSSRLFDSEKISYLRLFTLRAASMRNSMGFLSKKKRRRRREAEEIMVIPFVWTECYCGHSGCAVTDNNVFNSAVCCGFYGHSVCTIWCVGLTRCARNGSHLKYSFTQHITNTHEHNSQTRG